MALLVLLLLLSSCAGIDGRDGDKLTPAGNGSLAQTTESSEVGDGPSSTYTSSATLDAATIATRTFIPDPSDIDIYDADFIASRDLVLLATSYGVAMTNICQDLSIHTARILTDADYSNIAVSPDGRFLAGYSYQANTIEIVDLDAVAMVAEFPLEAGTGIPGDKSIVWAPDSKHLAIGTNRSFLLWWPRSNEVKQFTMQDFNVFESSWSITGFEWSPEGSLLAITSRAGAWVYNIEISQVIFSVPYYPIPITIENIEWVDRNGISTASKGSKPASR